jgi:nitric oxide reductase activation protein
MKKPELKGVNLLIAHLPIELWYIPETKKTTTEKRRTNENKKRNQSGNRKKTKRNCKSSY